MTMVTMANVGEVLKNVYLGPLRYQMNDQVNAFLAQIEKTSRFVSAGDSMIKVPLRYGRVGGIGNRSDDGDLPTPNPRKTKQATLTTKNIFARFQITDKIMKASKSDVASFSNMLEQQIDDCRIDAQLDFGRQTLGNGTGALATIDSVSDLVLTLKTGAGEPGTMYFVEGMLVDIYTTTTKDTSEAEVTAVDEAAGTITVSSATGAAQNDVIYLAGNKDLELSGLKYVFEESSIYGLAKATYPWLTPTRTNVAGEIADVTIQTAIDKVRRRAGSKINFLMGSAGVRRAYMNYLLATKNIVNSMELKGGWSAISFTSGNTSAPLVVDDLLGPGKLYGLALDNWMLHQIDDWDWLNDDGAMLTRVTNKAAYEATLAKYADLACDKPIGQFELYGIVEHF